MDATGTFCYTHGREEVKYMITSIIMMIAMILIFWVPVIYLFVLAVKALKKYLKSANVRKEKTVQITLGAAIKEHRTHCKMTQEFVAESIGVSRQAVSKWESGASDPSTSNLFAMAKLFGISAEELLKGVNGPADHT